MDSWINFLVKNGLSGVLLGVGAGALLGFIIYVSAAEPGAVRNPLFSPSDDDVWLAPECVTARYKKNDQTIAIFPSSSGKTYPASTVVSGAIVGSAGQITCKAGWFMTGCSSFCAGNPDPDEAMIGQNTCQGTPSGGCNPDYTFIRCCKNL